MTKINKVAIAWGICSVLALVACGGGGTTSTMPKTSGGPGPRSTEPPHATSSPSTPAPTPTPTFAPGLQTSGFFPLADQDRWNYTCGNRAIPATIVANAIPGGYSVTASIPTASFSVTQTLSNDGSGNTFISAVSFNGGTVTAFGAAPYLPDGSRNFTSTFPGGSLGEILRTLIDVGSITTPAGTWSGTLMYHDTISGTPLDTFQYAHNIGPVRVELDNVPNNPHFLCLLTSYTLH